MPYPGLLHPEPLPLQQSTGDPYLLSPVQFSSLAQSCLTLCEPMDHSTPGLPVHHQLPESTQTHVHWISDAIQPSYPPSSPLLLPSIFPSIGVFSNESALSIKWPKYWSFSFKIHTSSEDTQTQFCLSLCGVSGSWCIEGIFGPSECLWRIWGLILNMIFTLLPSCSGFSFALGSGVSPQNQQCRVGENEKKQ